MKTTSWSSCWFIHNIFLEVCMDTYKTGNYIREKRKKNKMTQEELAEHIGVSPRTISTWENGSVDIKKENLEKIADALGVSYTEVFTGQDLDVDDHTKTILDERIKELSNKVEEVGNITITIEEGGIATTDIAVIAAAIAYLALGLAIKASYPDAAFMPYFVVIAFIVGTAIYVIGRKRVRNAEKRLKVRKNK